MKKRLFAFMMGLFLITSTDLFSQFDFGITGGFSTPNNNINDVWNTSRLRDTSNILGNLYRDGTKFGYNLGIKLRFPLSTNLLFIGGLGFHRFPQTDQTFHYQSDNPNAKDTIVTELRATQTLIPISLGLNYYLFRSAIGVYGIGELSYNYILNNVEYSGVPLKASMSPSDNRVGCGLGLGFDFDLKVIVLNLETKYNIANLIGRSSEENSKSYLSVNVGIFFGNSKKDTKKETVE